MAERTIRHVFANYRETVEGADGVKRVLSRTAFRGSTVDLPASEEKRLDALGALEVKDADDLQASSAADAFARALNPDDEHPEQGAQPVPEAPAAETPSAEYDARGQSLADVQAWIESAKPNASETVAAAYDDSEAAETLLEAERLTHGQDPRSTVEGPLQKIIDGP